MPRVLVVDDDPDISEALKHALEYAGYEAAVVLTGVAALAEVRRHPPDLVLLDQMLPDVDGSEVCRRLRAGRETQRLPIIFLSARAEESARVRALALGADDYVTKPFSLDELLLRVRAVLRRATPVESGLPPEWVRRREQLRVWSGYADLHFQRGEWRDCLEVSRSILRECDEVLSADERSRIQERLTRCAEALGEDDTHRASSAPARAG